MRITHIAAMMEQAKTASPKGEENGLSVQREAESDHAEKRGKEERYSDRERETQRVKERLSPGKVLSLTRLSSSTHSLL